jgi:hypothetical protein
MSLQLSSSASLAYLRKLKPIHTCHNTMWACPSLVASGAMYGSLRASTHRPSHGTASAGPVRNPGAGSSYRANVRIAYSSNVSGNPDDPSLACPAPGDSKHGCKSLIARLIVAKIASFFIMVVGACFSLRTLHHSDVPTSHAHGDVLDRCCFPDCSNTKLRSETHDMMSTHFQAWLSMPKATFAQGVRPSPPQPAEPIAYEVAARTSLDDQLPQSLQDDWQSYAYDPQTEDAAVTASRRWAPYLAQ